MWYRRSHEATKNGLPIVSAKLDVAFPTQELQIPLIITAPKTSASGSQMTNSYKGNATVQPTSFYGHNNQKSIQTTGSTLGNTEGKRGLLRTVSDGLRASDLGARNSIFFVSTTYAPSSCHSGLELYGPSDFIPASSIWKQGQVLIFLTASLTSSKFMSTWSLEVWLLRSREPMPVLPRCSPALHPQSLAPCRALGTGCIPTALQTGASPDPS